MRSFGPGPAHLSSGGDASAAGVEKSLSIALSIVGASVVPLAEADGADGASDDERPPDWLIVHLDLVITSWIEAASGVASLGKGLITVATITLESKNERPLLDLSLNC